jgi:hypothetical protein
MQADPEEMYKFIKEQPKKVVKIQFQTSFYGEEESG